MKTIIQPSMAYVLIHKVLILAQTVFVVVVIMVTLLDSAVRRIVIASPPLQSPSKLGFAWFSFRHLEQILKTPFGSYGTTSPSKTGGRLLSLKKLPQNAFCIAGGAVSLRTEGGLGWGDNKS